jgi:long-chain fatty acid transport protein
MLTPALAMAGGFSIYEAGAKATGMGCAVSASIDDGSAMFYNIAAISFMPGSVVDLNLMPVIPSSKYRQASPPTPGATGETVSQSFLVPGFGATHNSGKLWAVGLGVSAPFGLGVQWENPTEWIGRFTSYDVNLATVYITPAVSFRVTPQLSLAVGADIATQHLQLNRFSPQRFGGNSELVNAIDAKLEGTSDLNITACFGGMWKPTAKLSLGVMYHMEKTMKYGDGTGTLSNVAPAPLRAAVEGALDQLAGEPGKREYRLSTELGLPSMLSLGVAYRFHERLLVEFDAVHFGWSNFDKLELTFDPDPTGSLSSTILEKYEDRWQYRVGADITVSEPVSIFLGYARDKTPQPVESMSPLLPDATRNDYSIGAQFRTGRWRFTASWMAVINEARNNVNDDGTPAIFEEELTDLEAVELRTMEAGAYETTANVFAIGAGYFF